MRVPSTRKPELAAPAGKTETFFAAIRAGADAVYLGLKKFNARLKSENFTIADLSRLIPYAQDLGKKVYVALNTLVKQAELPEAVALLAALAKLKVDAVILADAGLAAVARERFPGLRLHASTQAGVHSSAGAAAAERFGFKRVILARELTREEVGLIRQRTGLELEVFVHGALCYSLSGFCLASSFIGGMSGNRGLCTQVCRRAFLSGGKEAAFFSPRDLALLDAVPDLAGLGINAFKIEGRLKSAAYVSAVVSAYRRAIDDPASVRDLHIEISSDFARKKTAFFFEGVPAGKSERVLQGDDETGAVGVFAGEVIEAGADRLFLRSGVSLSAGDSIRIQPATGFEGKRYKLATVVLRDGISELRFHHPAPAAPGDRIFLVETKSAANGPLPELGAPRPFTIMSPAKAQALVDGFGPKQEFTPGASFFSIKVDDTGWLAATAAAAPNAARVIVSIDRDSGRRLATEWETLPAGLKKKIAIGFPLFIPETEQAEYADLTRDLAERGVSRFWVESLGALGTVRAGFPAAKILAGPALGALNGPARGALRSLGAEAVCSPLEDDFLNIRNARRAPAASVVYTHVPLFSSRIDPGLAEGERLRDRNDNRFFFARRQGLSFLVGADPICLFAKRGKLEELGVRDFILDLCFLTPDENFLRDLLDAYHERRRVLPSTLFNFKRELR